MGALKKRGQSGMSEFDRAETSTCRLKLENPVASEDGKDA